MVNITTARCTLSSLKLGDFRDLIRLKTNDKVREYLGGIPKTHKVYINLLHAMFMTKEHHFTVRLTASAEIIGHLIVAPHHNSSDMEISYMFFPAHWGNGYAKEAVKTLLDFCKIKLKLSHVVSETQVANERSCRLLEGLGYRRDSEVTRFGAKQRIYVYDFHE